MTLQHDAVKKYHKREIISCCAVAFKDLNDGKRDTLDICVNGIWMTIKPPVKDYRHYSHTYSPDALKEFFPEYYNKRIAYND